MGVVLSNTEALSLGTTIGTILTAIVDAQAQSARATVEFVNEVGFIAPTDPAKPDELRSVAFRYRKRDANNQLAEFAVEIPLLGLVDIPVISVKKATIAFNYEITTATTPAPGGTTPPRPNPLAGRVPVAAIMKGRVMQKGTDERERSTLAVTIEIEKSPLPIGLERVLDILEAAAAESQVPPPPPIP